MAIREHKPTSNDCRNVTGSDFTGITTSAPEKSLLRLPRDHAGCNNNGRITVHRQDGGHKRQHRVIDFKRSEDNVVATAQTIEYDPSRSVNIALIHYEGRMRVYILAPKGLEVGMKLASDPEADIKVGNALPLKNIPAGTAIHNIEMKPGEGGQLIRSAGTSAQVLGKESRYVLIRLNSGEVRMILAACRATIGSVGNEQHELINAGKAGCSHWMRRRLTVCGSVMNPDDHPHGDGGGRAPIGRKAPVSPWGQSALGYETRNKKARSDKPIARRRKDK